MTHHDNKTKKKYRTLWERKVHTSQSKEQATLHEMRELLKKATVNKQECEKVLEDARKLVREEKTSSFKRYSYIIRSIIEGLIIGLLGHHFPF